MVGVQHARVLMAELARPVVALVDSAGGLGRPAGDRGAIRGHSTFPEIGRGARSRRLDHRAVTRGKSPWPRPIGEALVPGNRARREWFGAVLRVMSQPEDPYPLSDGVGACPNLRCDLRGRESELHPAMSEPLAGGVRLTSIPLHPSIQLSARLGRAKRRVSIAGAEPGFVERTARYSKPIEPVFYRPATATERCGEFADRTSILNVRPFEPFPILIEGRNRYHFTVYLNRVFAGDPDGPASLLVKAGLFGEGGPPVVEEESMVRGTLDALSILECHPEHRLYSAPGDIHYSSVSDGPGGLIQTSDGHSENSTAGKKRELSLARKFVHGRLKSLPQLLDGQRVQLVPFPANPSGQIEENPSPLREAGRAVPYPLAGDVDGKTNEEL